MRRRLEIDNRPNWRDPDMPVSMKVIIEGKVQLYPCHPEHVRQYYASKIINNSLEPDWWNDPSYNWSKSKSKGKLK